MEDECVGDLFTLDYKSSQLLAEECTVCGFELDYSIISKAKTLDTKFDKISKYPTTKLDFNFVIPSNMHYRDIIIVANSLKTDLNYAVSLLDVFDNKNGNLSYTLHYEVNSLDRTLTSEDIETFHSLVISTFEANNIKLKL